MKKRVLGILSAIMVLAVVLPVSGVAGAQSEATADVAPELRPALAIESPNVARVGQPVTVRVVDRHTGRPVPRAGVWAVHVDDSNSIEADTDLTEQNSYFIGWTDQNGEIEHRFRRPGRYVLAAVKDGFMPGFSKITIVSRKALAIKAPDKARVGQQVTIRVFDRNDGTPVPRAGVWVVRINSVLTETASTNDAVAEISEAEAYAELAKKRGYFIGWTDGNGKVKHQFRVPGKYVLVSVKEGYTPALARIEIVLTKTKIKNQPALSLSRSTITNKPLTILAAKEYPALLGKET